MNIIYYDIARLAEHEEDAIGVRFRLLKELLRESDLISLHTPLNDTTRHLIGAEELSLMKESAILVNTARGPVIDEAALYAALTEGKDSRRRSRRFRSGAAATGQSAFQTR